MCVCVCVCVCGASHPPHIHLTLVSSPSLHAGLLLVVFLVWFALQFRGSCKVNKVHRESKVVLGVELSRASMY